MKKTIITSTRDASNNLRRVHETERVHLFTKNNPFGELVYIRAELLTTCKKPETAVARLYRTLTTVNAPEAKTFLSTAYRVKTAVKDGITTNTRSSKIDGVSWEIRLLGYGVYHVKVIFRLAERKPSLIEYRVLPMLSQKTSASIANQYTLVGSNSIAFQSYYSLIAVYDRPTNTLFLGCDWDYSRTTMKWLWEWLRVNVPYVESSLKRYKGNSGADKIRNAIKSGYIVYVPDMR